MRGLTVHAGFAKTGTTTLQQSLFSQHSQIDYLGKPYITEPMAAEMDDLIFRDSLAPSPSMDVTRKNISNNSDGRVKLLSDERLVSFSKVRDGGLVARRLKGILGCKRVLFTIRNQWDILKSAYLSGGRLLFHAPEPHSGLFVGFREWLMFSRKNLGKSFLKNIDYSHIIEYYSCLFGRKNVCILLFEEMAAQPDLFLENLCHFLGIDFSEAMERMKGSHENRSIEMVQLDFERFKSRLFHAGKSVFAYRAARLLHRVKSVFSNPAQQTLIFPEEMKKWLGDYYKSGNQKLAESFNLPLREFGYPV